MKLASDFVFSSRIVGSTGLLKGNAESLREGSPS